MSATVCWVTNYYSVDSFICGCCVMELSRSFFVEAKMFVPSTEEGYSALRIVERSRGLSHVV